MRRSDLFQSKWLTVSNVLTCSRIVAAPIVAFGIYREWWFLTFVLFFFASVTDVLDGYCARKFGDETELGKILDPIADKIFLLTCFIALAFFSSPSFQIPRWFVYLVLVRETALIIGSGFLLITRTNFYVAPTLGGKLTTFFQLLFIFWIFMCHFFKWMPTKTYLSVLIFLTIFSFLSFLQYFRRGLLYLLKQTRSLYN